MIFFVIVVVFVCCFLEDVVYSLRITLLIFPGDNLYCLFSGCLLFVFVIYCYLLCLLYLFLVSSLLFFFTCYVKIYSRACYFLLAVHVKIKIKVAADFVFFSDFFVFSLFQRQVFSKGSSPMGQGCKSYY